MKLVLWILFAIVVLIILIIISLKIKIKLFTSGDGHTLSKLFSTPETQNQQSGYVTISLHLKFTKIEMYKLNFDVDFIKVFNPRKPKEPKKPKNVIDLFAFLQKNWKSLLLKSTLEKLKVRVTLGTGDACQTAVVCGLFYSIVGPFFAIAINSFKNYKNVNLVAFPDFAKADLKYEFLCIFTFNLTDIILEYIKSKLLIKKRRVI